MFKDILSKDIPMPNYISEGAAKLLLQLLKIRVLFLCL
jgi:hypothetical protein